MVEKNRIVLRIALLNYLDDQKLGLLEAESMLIEQTILLLILHGIDVPKNDEEALEWFRLAAEQGRSFRSDIEEIGSKV
tara:strand:- start:983 stop:1219 length:237 start_codon:yes stop_codon:yes gene_type:complete